MGGTAVKYYVVLPDGQRFGPADVTLLNQWAAEGRILPQTMLEEEGTLTRLTASSLPGLSIAQMGPPPPGPFSSPSSAPQTFSGYYQGPAMPTDSAQSDLNTAWILTGLSFAVRFFAPCISVIGLVFAILGVVFATRASAKGHPNAQPAKVFAWIALAIHCLLLLGGGLFFGLFH